MGGQEGMRAGIHAMDADNDSDIAMPIRIMIKTLADNISSKNRIAQPSDTQVTVFLTCVHVCVRACECVHVRACMHACKHACVGMRASGRACTRACAWACVCAGVRACACDAPSPRQQLPWFQINWLQTWQ